MGKYAKLFGVMTALFLGASFLRPHIAHAGAIYDQLINYAPGNIASDVEYRCNVSGWGNVQEQWISARGAPTSTTVTVPYGASSAPLQLNYLTYKCNGSSSVILGSFQITGTATPYSPDLPQLDGMIGDMPYGGPGESKTGDLRDFDFPTGGATTSKDIGIAFQSRGTITALFQPSNCAIWENGDYEGQTPDGTPHNFDWCATGWQTFTVHVNVLPPPVSKINIQNCVAGDASSRVTISWSGSSPGTFYLVGTGYYVDVSADNFSSYSNKFVATAANSGSTTAPDGFSPAISFTPGNRYYTRVYNGTESNIVSFVAPDCSPPTVSCGGVTTTPALPESNVPFNVSFSFSISRVSYDIHYSAALTMSPSAGVTIPGPTPANPQTIVAGNTNGGASFNGMTAPAGVYSGTFTVSGDISLSCPFGGGGGQPPPITVAAKPYLRVYGGDVLAGTDFDTGSCTSANSGIIGYNKGAAGGFAGAGTQLANQAPSNIVDFTSAALRAPPGNLLAFANTGGGVDPTYGGSFGNVPCVSDYSKFNGTDPGGTVGGGSLVTGQTFAYNNIADSSHVVLKHNGNVTISGDIIYSRSGTWTNVSQIPSFYLIVEGGNIYIDKGVTQLDGVYVAQGGTIYTCTNGIPATAYTAADTTAAASCAVNPLVVNGAFIANQVKFLRTRGTLASAAPGDVGYPAPAPNIAEVFNFSPELWLVNPGLTSSGSRYDSITSLPPVL